MTGSGRNLYSPRQRLIVLTFPTVEEAEAWDESGQEIAIKMSGVRPASVASVIIVKP